MEGSKIALFIFNILYIGLGIYIFYEIVTSILRVKRNNQEAKVKLKRNPFSDLDAKDEIIEVQQNQLSRALLVLSALLPVMILVPIYIHDPDTFYQTIPFYMERKGVTLVGIYIVSFVLGIGFARVLLNPDSKDSNNEQPQNIGLIGKQLGYQEICYLSFALCIILFSYFGENPKIIAIKVVTTLFLAGNAFYLVFRRNIKLSMFGISSTKKNVNTDESNS